MNPGRIEHKLSSLAARSEKALALFLTAGYPSLDSTVDLVLDLEQGGADIIELGMPFSDPLADGPVIQHSSQIALRNGMTLDRVLGYARAVRERSSIPLVLMGYLNPLLAYGVGRFFERASAAGIDGVILPEVPLEEVARYDGLIAQAGLANILLVSPATPAPRIQAIDAASRGFLYCVSTTGVTGALEKKVAAGYVENVKRYAKKNPVLVGFGVSTPDGARQIAEHADGVIIGSALIRKMEEDRSPHALRAWVGRFKNALRS